MLQPNHGEEVVCQIQPVRVSAGISLECAILEAEDSLLMTWVRDEEGCVSRSVAIRFVRRRINGV